MGALARDREKHIQGRNQVSSPSGYSLRWFCWDVVSQVSLLLGLYPMPHLKPRHQTSCNDWILRISGLMGPCKWSTLSTFSGLGQWHPYSTTFLVSNHRAAFCKIPPKKHYTGKMLLRCNIILIPRWNTFWKWFIHLLEPPSWNLNAYEHMKDAEKSSKKETYLSQQQFPSDFQTPFLNEYLLPTWWISVL